MASASVFQVDWITVKVNPTCFSYASGRVRFIPMSPVFQAHLGSTHTRSHNPGYKATVIISSVCICPAISSTPCSTVCFFSKVPCVSPVQNHCHSSQWPLPSQGAHMQLCWHSPGMTWCYWEELRLFLGTSSKSTVAMPDDHSLPSACSFEVDQHDTPSHLTSYSLS